MKLISKTSPCIKAHANGPNIVGPNNVVAYCVRLHGTTTMLALVGTCCVYSSLKPVKRLGPCKRTQHCWPTTRNNVGSCWHLLRLFAWAIKAHANGANIVGPNNAVTCCVRLHGTTTMLVLVGTCCV